MFGRTRFQQGSLQREARKTGPEAWIFRWYECDAEGRRQRQYCVIGTVEQYPTEAAAQAAAAALRLDINVENRRAKPIMIVFREGHPLALKKSAILAEVSSPR